jgi:hypothetical protein
MYYVINSMYLLIFIVFFDCRCCYHHYNDDVTTRFLLLKHFWPLINNVLHQNEGLHIDGLNKKKIISPTGVKMSLRTLAPPRGGTSLWWPLTTTAPKKTRKKRSQLLHSPAYWPSLRFAQRTLIIDHSVIFDTPCIENKTYNLHCNHRQFVTDAIHRGVKANFSSV